MLTCVNLGGLVRQLELLVHGQSLVLEHKSDLVAIEGAFNNHPALKFGPFCTRRAGDETFVATAIAVAGAW